MARTVSSTNNFVHPSNYGGEVPVLAQPATLSLWARFSATSPQNVMFCTSDGGNYFGLSQGYVTAGRIAAVIGVTAGESVAETTTGITVDTWHHCCAVFASSTSRTAYIDGGSAGTNSVSRAPTDANNITIGAFRDTIGNQYGPMAGQVAEAAIWNVELTVSEIGALARGAPTYMIRPSSLAGYWPLYGLLSPEPDLNPGILSATRWPMTLVGTPPQYAGHGLVAIVVPPVIPVIEIIDTSFGSVSPDSIAASTNLDTTLSHIQDDPDNPGTSWLTATSATSATDLRITFPNPPGTPSGVQNFKFWLRKTTGAPTPTVDISLYENGSLVALLANDVAITSTTGQLVTAEWNSSSLGTADGSLVECRILSTVGSTADTPGAMPAYDGTGQATQVGSATITTTITPAKPSTVNSGDLLILQVLARNQDASPNHGQGPTTVSGFTPFPDNTYGADTNTNYAHQALYWRIAGAGEANQTASVTCTGGTTSDLAMARIYRFTAANGFSASPVEGITENLGSASPMAAPVTGATPGGTNRLAVCFGAIASSDTAIGSMINETAGDWTEAVGGAGGATTTGGDGTLNVQTADASAGTAISGGEVAFTLTTSEHWTTVACYLVPAMIPGSAVNTVEIGAVEWNVQYPTPEGGVTIPIAMSSYRRWRI